MVEMDLAAARWSLDMLGTDSLVDLAVRALEAGADGEATVLIAGMSDPLDRDVRPLVPEFFREQGCRVPPRIAAAKLVVDHLAGALRATTVQPVRGAQDIVAVRIMLQHVDQPDLSALAEQLASFELILDLAAGGEWATTDLEDELVENAELFIAAGGLTIG